VPRRDSRPSHQPNGLMCFVRYHGCHLDHRELLLPFGPWGAQARDRRPKESHRGPGTWPFIFIHHPADYPSAHIFEHSFSLSLASDSRIQPRHRSLYIPNFCLTERVRQSHLPLKPPFEPLHSTALHRIDRWSWLPETSSSPLSTSCDMNGSR